MSAPAQARRGSRPLRRSLTVMGRLLRYVTRYWQLRATLVLIALATLLEVLTPAMIGGIIDVVRAVASRSDIPSGAGVEGLIYRIFGPWSRLASEAFRLDPNLALLGTLSLALVLVAALTGALNYLQRYALASVSQRASFDIRSDLYNSLLEQSFGFYDRQRTGQLMARATGDIGQIERFFGFGLSMFVSSALLFALVVYSLFSIDLQLALIAVAFIPPMMLTTFRFASKTVPLWARIREQFGDITSAVQENIMGVRVVRGFAREAFEEERFRGECGAYLETNIEASRIRAFYFPLATFFASTGLVLILWLGGGLVIGGALSLGSLAAFYFYVMRLTQPIRMFGFMTAMFQRATAAAERVFEVIDARVEVADREGAAKLESVEGRVAFEDVWFGYDGVNMVLRGVSLEVRPGETVAILGATGSGKSSFINLIPRFYDATRGRITVDGRDVRDITVKSLRRHIGIVRQDPFLFSTTIWENIAYGVEDARPEEVEAAARRAQIHDFIASLPEGYKTRVGERGVTLSGGQKQRIAIARALLKDPRILILDDSTSSVDSETEHEIQRALEELYVGRTTFIITQRLSSIRTADYIVVLDKGKVAEIGTHEQLLEKMGIYYRLYQTQVAGDGRPDGGGA